MRTGLLWAVGLWSVGVGQLFAQPTPPADQPDREAKAPATAPATNTAGGGTSGSGTGGTSTDAKTTAAPPPLHGYWARAEYLMWWTKSAPLPVPIVTTGDPSVGFDPNAANTVNTAGAIGQPGTQVLLGGQGIDTRVHSGLRLTLGGWIDNSSLFGIEGTGFALERLVRSIAFASDPSGNPPLYFPIFSGIAGAERGIPIADPLRQFSGDVVFNSTLRLWGAEGNGVVTLIRTPGVDWTLLSGFRYADLLEHLQINNTTTDLIFGNVTGLNDEFDTRNQFYGGQVGSRLAVRGNRFALEATGKVALGYTYQVVETVGNITQFGPNPLVPPGLGTFPGGLFTQPSNMGRRHDSTFSILPSMELKLCYAFGPRAWGFIGYDILYWSKVVRPGNQIDRNVNLTQNAVLDPNGVGTLVGPAVPAPLFNHSDFWAQGITLGLGFYF
jgi:hypothetical protein